MLEEFVAAENLLEKAGLLNGKLPISVEAIMAYMAREGLGLRYYNPADRLRGQSRPLPQVWTRCWYTRKKVPCSSLTRAVP